MGAQTIIIILLLFLILNIIRYYYIIKRLVLLFLLTLVANHSQVVLAPFAMKHFTLAVWSQFCKIILDGVNFTSYDFSVPAPRQWEGRNELCCLLLVCVPSFTSVAFSVDIVIVSLVSFESGDDNGRHDLLTELSCYDRKSGQYTEAC